MSDSRPLGVFDSGVGGLTVLRAIRRRLPAEPLVFLGDTARVPYGTRSDDTVLRYAHEALAFLAARGVKAVAVACNTVSAVALERLLPESPVPLVGVLEPGAAEACRRTRNGRIGVIGTPATVRSGAYLRRIQALRPGTAVVQAACPLFVPLAEEGWVEGGVPQMIAETYLGPLRRAGVDTLVMGCTHYPLLAPVVAGTMGGAVTLVDSAEAAAASVERVLDEGGLRAPAGDPGGAAAAPRAAGATAAGPAGGSDARTGAGAAAAAAPADHFFVTDSSERFREVGERFLGGPLERLEQVGLPVWPQDPAAV